MTQYKILQFSDLHLCRHIEQTVANWQFCLKIVEQEKPDLVVLTGDFVLDDPDRDDDQKFSFEQIRKLSAPWIALPGNHDLGDSTEDPYQGQAITSPRRDRFLSLYGSDRWRRDIGDWTLLGINTMLPNSQLQADSDQLDWLRQEASSCGRPIILFLHKPLCVDVLNEAANPAWAIPPNGRAAILNATAGSDLRLIASGHLHCFRHLPTDQFDMVWCPATAIMHTGKVSGVSRTTGWLSFQIDGDQVEWTHHTSPSLRPVDITDLLSSRGALRNASVEELLAVGK